MTSLYDPVTGPLRRLDFTKYSKGEPDVFSCAASPGDLTLLGLPYADTCVGSGAGLEKERAQGAAEGEFAERYCLRYYDESRFHYGSVSELRNRFPHTPGAADYALFSADHPLELPYSRFTDETVIAWTECRNLTAKAPALMPASLVFMPYFSGEGEVVPGYSTSTGAACAWDTTTATLKGVLECIERDAFAITWRRMLGCPRIHIDDASRLKSMFDKRFARPGLEYRLYLTSLDAQVHSVLGCLIDHRRSPPAVMVGGAAGLDPVKVVEKTLLELAQCVKWIGILDVNNFDPGTHFENVKSFQDRVLLFAGTDMRSALEFLERDDSVDLSTLPNLGSGSIAEDLAYCVEAISGLGETVLSVDCTTVDIRDAGLHVVKSYVPGMEQIEGRFGTAYLGGLRWQTVPEKLGRKSGTKCANPIPHPYP